MKCEEEVIPEGRLREGRERRVLGLGLGLGHRGGEGEW